MTNTHCFHLFFSLNDTNIEHCSHIICKRDSIYLFSENDFTDYTDALKAIAQNAKQVFFVSPNPKLSSKLPHFISSIHFAEFIQHFSQTTLTKSW